MYNVYREIRARSRRGIHIVVDERSNKCALLDHEFSKYHFTLRDDK